MNREIIVKYTNTWTYIHTTRRYKWNELFKNDHNIIFMTLTIITDDMYKALLELFKHFFLTIEMNMIQSVWVTSPIMELSLWKVHETCKAI